MSNALAAAGAGEKGERALLLLQIALHLHFVIQVPPGVVESAQQLAPALHQRAGRRRPW